MSTTNIIIIAVCGFLGVALIGIVVGIVLIIRKNKKESARKGIINNDDPSFKYHIDINRPDTSGPGAPMSPMMDPNE